MKKIKKTEIKRVAKVKNKAKPKTSKPKRPKQAKIPKVKKVGAITNGIDLVEKADGSYAIIGKSGKYMEGVAIERKERIYKFDEKLVNFYNGADTKESNLAIRDALISLGKTPEMTGLFQALKGSGIDYNENGMSVFIKSLVSIIKGHNNTGLLYIDDKDIQAIYDNNLKLFTEIYEAKERIALNKEDDYEGFSN